MGVKLATIISDSVTCYSVPGTLMLLRLLR